MIKISLTDDFDACFAVRREVFIQEQSVPEEIELDEYDATALHFLARDGETPVGTARVVIDGQTAKIGRVCIRKSARGTGLGADLMRAVMTHIQDMGTMKEAVLGAQIHALAFYEKLGFIAYGPEFDDAGIPHRMMRHPL